jgi:Asp-tRNA(Asn)/Glu-tRNA(Gln) amidotransferase A subunit family amidase
LRSEIANEVAMNFTLEESNIRDIHAAYLAGTLTCVELVQAYLDRIAAYDQRGLALNAFVALNIEMIVLPYHEPDLFRLGYAFEQATLNRRPPPSTPRL